MERGKYIVIEGGEGVGKTTQVRRLATRLDEEGVSAVVLREPGGTAIGEEIRKVLKNKDLERSPMTNNLLFAAARADLADREIRPRLERGQWPLSARNWWSTLAYQGSGEGLNTNHIRMASELALKEFLNPDLVLVLNVPSDEANERLIKRGGTDYFEQMDKEFHERVGHSYRIICEQLGGIAVDGVGTETEVEQRIWKHVEPLVEDYRNE